MPTPGFGTRNLYIFEDGLREIAMLDLLHFERRTIDFASLGLGLHPQLLDDITGFIHQWLREAMEDKADRTRLEDGARTAGVLKNLLPLRTDTTTLMPALALSPWALFHPLEATFWITGSDTPAESYHEEDYEEGWVRQLETDGPMTEFNFAFKMSRLENAMRSFPVLDDQIPLACLSLPRQAVTMQPLPADAPLPLAREFIGPGGVGTRGLLCNLGIEGSITSENLLCVPLLRRGGLFMSLYGQIVTPLPAPGLMPLRRIKALPECLKTATGPGEGFRLVREEELESPARWICYERGNGHDVVHVYRGLPGIEADMKRSVPMFIVAARAQGTTSASARGALLSGLLSA